MNNEYVEIIEGGGEKRVSCFSRKPGWLLNAPDEDVWTYNMPLCGQPEAARRVVWDYVGVEQIGLVKGKLEYWKRIGKDAAYWYMEAEGGESIKPSSGCVKARDIRSLVYWLAFERRCARLMDVTPHDVGAYEEYVSSLGITKNAVIAKLSSVKLLWELRGKMVDSLTFNPYPGKNAITKKAKRLGRRGGHTATIKPDSLFFMLNQALRIVDESGVWLDHVPLYMDLKKKHRRDYAAKKFKRLTGLSSSKLTRRVRVIYGAALTIVFLLLGERKHELAETTIDEVRTLLEEGGSELASLLHKTANTISGRHTARPVIPELIKALEVVLLITSEKRKSYGGNKLFIKIPMAHCANKNPQIELLTNNIYNLLDAFAKEVGYKEKLRPHMFRRAFSMLWAWRYEVGDLHLLSHMLYHNNEIFTKRYTEDEDVWGFLPEAEQELAFNVMEKSLLGEQILRGGFGKILSRYRRVLLANTTTIRPEDAHLHIERLFKIDGIRLVAHEHGYCVVSPKRTRHQLCAKQEKYDEHNDCTKCANYLVTEARKEYWEKQYEAHKKVFERTEVDVLRKVALQGMKKAEKVIGWLDGGLL